MLGVSHSIMLGATVVLVGVYMSGWIWTFLFLLMLIWHYWRVLLNILANSAYKPTPIPLVPTYHSEDVTVLICPTDLLKLVLMDVINSALHHPITKMIISCSGEKAQSQWSKIKSKISDPRLTVH